MIDFNSTASLYDFLPASFFEPKPENKVSTKTPTPAPWVNNTPKEVVELKTIIKEQMSKPENNNLWCTEKQRNELEDIWKREQQLRAQHVYEQATAAQNAKKLIAGLSLENQTNLYNQAIADAAWREWDEKQNKKIEKTFNKLVKHCDREWELFVNPIPQSEIEKDWAEFVHDARELHREWYYMDRKIMFEQTKKYRLLNNIYESLTKH